LPMPQAASFISSSTNGDAIAGGPDSGVQPQNVPEPGALALFAVVLFTSAMKAAWPPLYWGRAPRER
jgi:hypothetical protein